MPAYLKVHFADQGAGGGAALNTSQWTVSQIVERYLDDSNPPSSTALGWVTGSSFPQDFLFYPLTTTQGLSDYAQELLPKPHHSNEWLQFQSFYFGGVTMTEMTNREKANVLCKVITHKASDYEACKQQYA